MIEKQRTQMAVGYAAGLAGEPKPGNDKGIDFYYGWTQGKTHREETGIQATQPGEAKNG